ncbi:MAG TPA: hypothetical protein V6D05_09220 [Stenomitos sp.]
MPVISGNGNDVIRINGKNVQYQGIGHVRKDMALNAAVAATKDNGLDEYYINVQDDQGKTQRIVVYGDRLDFAFRNTKKEPIVEINGRQGKLVAFENERTTFVEGVVEGAKASLGDAFATLSQLAKTTMGNIVGAGALTMAGGATLLALAKPLGFVSKGFGAVLAGMAQPITLGALGVAALSILLIALSGAIRGGSAALTNHARMETIAGVTGEANQLNAQHPYDPSGEGSKDVPPAPQQPQRPTPPPVSKPQAWAPTPPTEEAASPRPVLQKAPPARSAQPFEFRKLTPHA